MNASQTVRIFVASPSDVAFERHLAEQVIECLKGQYRGLLRIEATLWEGLPLQPIAGYQEQIPDPADYDISVFVIWSRLGRPIGPPIDGVLQPTGTEYEYGRAIAGVRADPTKSILLFRKVAPVSRDLTQPRAQLDEALEQFAAVERFFDRLVAPDGRELARHTIANAAEFRTRLAKALDHLVSGIHQRRFGGAAARERPDWTEGSPFRGLGVFDQGHAKVFFGRTPHIEAAIEQLRKQAANDSPILLVFGRSGVGKSSFVRAGLAPMLVSPGVVDGVYHWETQLWEPSDAISGNLLRGMLQALLGAEVLAPLRAEPGLDGMERLLRDRPEAAIARLTATLAAAAHAGARAGATRLLLVIDPLEEVFTRQGVAEKDRLEFARALKTLVRSGLVWAIATMRSDFFERCVELPDLLELLEGGGQYHLPLPSREQIGEMVRLPAVVAGLAFEELPARGSLADVILNEMGNEADLLPLLQFTLAEVYRESGADASRLLKFSAYDSLGGIAGSIATRTREITENLRGELGPRFDAAADALFNALVGITIGDDELVVRQYAVKETLDADSATARLVERLLAERLLIVDKDDRNRVVATVSHESLFRRWQCLADWIENNLGFLRAHSRVRHAAERWRAEGRPADLLLPAGRQLEEAATLLLPRRAALAALDVEFLETSAAADRASRLTRRRVRRAVFAAMSVLCVISIVLAAVSRRHYRSALDAAQKAESAERKEALQRAVATNRSRDTQTLLKFLLQDLAARLDPASPRDSDLIEGISARTRDNFLAMDTSRDETRDKEQIAASMASAAGSLGHLERRQDELKLAERALAVYESAGGKDPGILTAYELLVVEAARYVEEFSRAKEMLDRAGARIAKDPRGIPAAALIDYLAFRGGLERTLGRIDSAVSYLEQAFALATKTYGPGSAETIRLLSDLGNVYRTKGDRPKAVKMYEQAIELTTRYKLTEQLALNFANLGATKLELGATPEAEELLRKAVELDEKRWGGSHRWVAVDLYKLGQVLIAAKKLPEARTRLDLAVSILRGDKTSLTFLARALESRAALFDAVGEHEPQLADLRECIQIRRAQLVPSHPETRRALQAVVKLLESLKRENEAAEFRALLKT